MVKDSLMGDSHSGSLAGYPHMSLTRVGQDSLTSREFGVKVDSSEVKRDSGSLARYPHMS